MPFLIRGFLLIFPQLNNATANLKLGENEYGDDEFPPPPPELLQQQYLYGTVPDSRQQAIPTNYAYPQSQGYASYAPGVGQTVSQKPQQAEVHHIPASTTPLEV